MKSRPLAYLATGLLLSCGLLTRVGGSPTATESNQARQEWVRRCLEDFRKIKVGMTRQRVESKFSEDGGLQSLTTPIRYVHPDCPYFMIDVKYDSPRHPANPSTAGTGKNDKVTGLSKPYIEYPSQD